MVRRDGSKDIRSLLDILHSLRYKMNAQEFKLSQKQKDVIRWFANDETWLLLSGTVRSGKSYGLDLGWLLWTQGSWHEPTDFIVSGHSVSSVKRNLMPEIKRFADAFGISTKFSHVGSYLQCGMHKYHIFGAKDSDAEEAVRGMTAGGAYFDEMTSMNESFIGMCVTRCSLEGAKIIGSMNPSYPLHYVKTEYIDKIEELGGSHMEFGFPDNPILTDKYVDMIARTLTGADYERMFLGKWVATAGLIYPYVNVKEEDEWYDRVTRFDKNTVAIDYSTSGIASFILCRKDKYRNTYVQDEWYHDGGGEGSSRQRTDAELIDELGKWLFRNGLDRKSVSLLPDPSAASFKAEARKQGWRISGANNDILTGIRVTGVALKNGKVIVSRKCRELLKELGTYAWDEKKSERGDDQPLKTRIHHGVDALRYYCMKNYRYLVHGEAIRKPAGW